MAGRPTVLAVDDQPESLESLKVVLSGARLLVRGPWDVTEADIKSADLVLVDLKLTDWPERSASGILTTWPEDGFALLGILRSHLGRLQKATPTSFALHSSFLDEVWPQVPAEYRAHALARLHDLEWIFTKANVASKDTHAEQVMSLALATRSLPKKWPEGDIDQTRNLLSHLLGLRQSLPWVDRAWDNVWDCHPPVHDLALPAHGSVFLRWLLQRILPYPCFLWDDRQLGARLGLHPDGLIEELESKRVAHGLSRARYGGMLSGFLGPRWWRTGVEDFLWTLTGGASTDLDVVRAALKKGGVDLEPLAPGRRIVCLNEAFEPIAELQHADDCIRIQPDDWPSYADPAWTTVELARKSSKLRALVVAGDRARLATT